MSSKIPDWFAALMSGMAEVFPGKGSEFTTAKAKIYWFALKDVGKDGINTAVKRALQTCRFMPTPAELRDLAGANITVNQQAERA